MHKVKRVRTATNPLPILDHILALTATRSTNKTLALMYTSLLTLTVYVPLYMPTSHCYTLLATCSMFLLLANAPTSLHTATHYCPHVNTVMQHPSHMPLTYILLATLRTLDYTLRYTALHHTRLRNCTTTSPPTSYHVTLLILTSHMPLPSLLHILALYALLFLATAMLTPTLARLLQPHSHDSH